MKIDNIVFSAQRALPYFYIITYYAKVVGR